MYKKVLEHTIIAAVDAIILYQGKVLLVLRKQEPCKGQWWIPGGRQYKGERGEEAIVRKVKEEIGIDVEIKKQVGV
jgi:colanic acid biosynthesis protein WcaH